MKDITFEARLIAATPTATKNRFVKSTMVKIKQQAKTPVSQHILTWFKHLHKPAFALLALVALLLAGGAVYAAIKFAPALLELIGKEVNQRGATEYSVAGFKDCAVNYGPVAEKFELKVDAPSLSDDDVKKIVQAKCELAWIQGFIKDTWPTYGTNPEWKDGDTIYYTRADILGKTININESEATLALGDGTEYKVAAAPDEKIKAYQAGLEIPSADVKTGDLVFTIAKVSEIYHDYRLKFQSKDTVEFLDNQMTRLGLVAVFKLSLPEKYYGEMQTYLTEVPECIGNPGEYCPNTSSIDIYPRNAGEGSYNPDYKFDDTAIFRQINGTVTELGSDWAKIKSRTGNTYSVTVGSDGFDFYNTSIAGAYAMDATLKVGSVISVNYSQPSTADPKTISKEQIQMVNLLLEGGFDKKNGYSKQY